MRSLSPQLPYKVKITPLKNCNHRYILFDLAFAQCLIFEYMILFCYTGFYYFVVETFQSFPFGIQTILEDYCWSLKLFTILNLVFILVHSLCFVISVLISISFMAFFGTIKRCLKEKIYTYHTSLPWSLVNEWALYFN